MDIEMSMKLLNNVDDLQILTCNKVFLYELGVFALLCFSYTPAATSEILFLLFC